MARIFVAISLLPVIMIVATLWLGWRVGDYAQQAVDLRQLDRKIAETEPGAPANFCTPPKLVLPTQKAERR